MSKETNPAPKMSAEKKTSSVQLLRKIYFKTGTLFESDFERAEQMHKEEVEEAWNSAGGGDAYHTGEQYYNETFGGNNETH